MSPPLSHEGIAILVRVAPEILKLMKDGDVEPVVILGVEEQPDGTYDMTLMKPAIVAERDRYREVLELALEWVPEPECSQFRTAAFRERRQP